MTEKNIPIIPICNHGYKEIRYYTKNKIKNKIIKSLP